MPRQVGFFILGVLLGMLIMHFLQGKQIEELYWEKENLQVQLYETSQQLRQMQEQQETPQPRVVNEIKINIEVEEDSFVEPGLKQNTYELVEGLLGQEVHALPYPLLYNHLDGRVVNGEDKKYRLKVKAVIVGEVLEYYLKAVKVDEEEEVMEDA